MKKLFNIALILCCSLMLISTISLGQGLKSELGKQEILNKLNDYITELGQINTNGDLLAVLSAHNTAMHQFLSLAVKSKSLTRQDRNAIAEKISQYLQRRTELERTLKSLNAPIDAKIANELIRSRRILMAWVDCFNGKIAEKQVQILAQPEPQMDEQLHIEKQ